MESRKELEEYFDNKYFNEEKNYREIIFKISRENNTNKNKILRIVATLLITIVGTMGIVMAATQIYNTYIKKDESIDLKGLFYTGESEFGSLYSDEITAGLNYNEESNMYYKIITNEEEYKKIKNKVNGLPENTEVAFENNFLMLITHGEVSAEFKERDLTISEITADNTTTNIVLKPKENLDYNKVRSSMYVIVDKTLLRENINIKKDFSCFKIKNDDTSIDKLPKDYNKEEAIKDGCMVIERFEDKGIVGGRVISENKNAFEDLIEASKEDVESYIRIFLSKPSSSRIIDIQYKNSIFIINSRELGDENITIDVCKSIQKELYADGSYMYRENYTERTDVFGGPCIFSVNYKY